MFINIYTGELTTTVIGQILRNFFNSELLNNVMFDRLLLNIIWGGSAAKFAPPPPNTHTHIYNHLQIQAGKLHISNFQFLDFNAPSTKWGLPEEVLHIVTFRVCSHNFKVQITKAHVKSWITVLDAAQSTAKATKTVDYKHI